MGQFRFTATGAHLPLDPSRKGEGDDCTIGAQPQNNSSGEKQ